MRSKWKGYFICKVDNFYTNSSVIRSYFNNGVFPVYSGKKWEIFSFLHPYMTGFRLKNFISTKLIGNIHSAKRKNRKKIGKKKKNG